MLIPPFASVLRRRALVADPVAGQIEHAHAGERRIGGELLRPDAAESPAAKLEFVVALLSSPHIESVVELRLGENELSAAGIRALAAAPIQVNELDLSGNALDGEHARDARRCRSWAVSAEKLAQLGSG